jgi:septal ring factor EnvC (AmiA/AmiB activator)
MNSTPLFWLRPAGALAICLAFSSCSDDPQLVRQREEQKVEISKLEGELAILEEKLEQVPKDRSDEVTQLKQDAETNRTQISQLESEIEVLEQKKADIEKQHEAYRQKYVLR